MAGTTARSHTRDRRKPQAVKYKYPGSKRRGRTEPFREASSNWLRGVSHRLDHSPNIFEPDVEYIDPTPQLNELRREMRRQIRKKLDRVAAASASVTTLPVRCWQLDGVVHVTEVHPAECIGCGGELYPGASYARCRSCDPSAPRTVYLGGGGFTDLPLHPDAIDVVTATPQGEIVTLERRAP